jgi:hypothetical protein
MKRIQPLRLSTLHPRAGRSAGHAAQDERESVPLLAGQRRRFIDQPGDVGIQPGLVVIFGVPVAVVVFLLPAVRGPG